MPQLHNHLTSHAGQPTIEVRGTNPTGQQRKRERVPAPHHLDYLDYRDPRAILRVADKPSRAVLGGYRTPRALLAKSQGVPLSIATHVPRNSHVTSPRLLRNNHQLLTTQNDLITSQNSFVTNHNQNLVVTIGNSETRPPLPPNNRPVTLNDSVNNNPTEYTITWDTYLAITESQLPSLITNERSRDTELPITPTHRPRIVTPTSSHREPINCVQNSPVHRLTRDTLPRRPSVDSEGYSYIDFDDNRRLGGLRVVESIRSNNVRLIANARSNSLDSEGYSYIDPTYRRVPGTARRVANEGTDEEVCPLCTMQQIQHLLAKPEDAYHSHRDT